MLTKLKQWLFGKDCQHRYQIVTYSISRFGTIWVTKKCIFCSSNYFREFNMLVDPYPIKVLIEDEDDNKYTVESADENGEPFLNNDLRITDVDGGQIIISREAANAIVKAVSILKTPE